MICIYSQLPSPLGLLTLVGRNDRLAAILWEQERPGRVPLGELEHQPHDPLLCEVQRQLNEYFAGQRQSFAVDLDFLGTGFQREVWQALMTIPFGETRTYRDIALQLGRSQAMRAVGAANGRNPISIIAPCHRVIGANGQLTGFAGGLAAKQWLLEREGVRVGRQQGELF